MFKSVSDHVLHNVLSKVMQALTLIEMVSFRSVVLKVLHAIHGKLVMASEVSPGPQLKQWVMFL